MGMDRVRPDRIKGAKKLVGDFLKDESSKPMPAGAVETGIKAAAVAGTIMGAHMTAAAAKDMRPTPHIERQVNTEALSEHEMHMLTENVYHEARGETLKGRLAVTQATLARLLSGKHGKNLIDVIFEQRQFSWTDDPKILLSTPDPKQFAAIRAEIASALRGKSVAETVHALVAITGIPAEAFFYKKVGFVGGERVKKFFGKLTFAGRVDKHDFFAEKSRGRVAKK